MSSTYLATLTADLYGKCRRIAPRSMPSTAGQMRLHRRLQTRIW